MQIISLMNNVTFYEYIKKCNFIKNQTFCLKSSIFPNNKFSSGKPDIFLMIFLAYANSCASN